MQPIYKYDNTRWSIRANLTPATPVQLISMPASSVATIAINTGPSAVVLVEFTTSSTADLDAGDGLFLPAKGLGPNGEVSEALLEALDTPLSAIRLTLVSGEAARFEVCQ